MRTNRLALAGLALVASTIIISCSSDNNSTPTNTGNAPAVGDTTLGSGSTVGGAGTLPIAETSVVDTTTP